MSRAIKGAFLFIILFLFLAILLTNHGRAVRSNENTSALVNAIDTSLDSVMEQKAYTIRDSNEFVADFLETLLIQYESDSDITVKILKQDMEKGLLSVEVDETYLHPNGSTGTVSVCRTVIFDQTAEKANAVTHTIQFWVDGELYKSYTLPEGAALIVPKDPQTEKVFADWCIAETGKVVSVDAFVADRDYIFMAKFN